MLKYERNRNMREEHPLIMVVEITLTLATDIP